MQIDRETIERQVTPEQAASRVAELLRKAQSGGISSAERQELDLLQDVRNRTQAAKQARDRALQQYEEVKRPRVEKLPNARSNFSAAATAVTRQGLNGVGDVESNFLRVQERLEQGLHQPMTIENIVPVLSDGSLDGLAPNQDAEQLHLEREQEERDQLIDELVRGWSRDQHARDVKRMLLNKPHVTLESLRQQVNDIRERDRLYAMTPAQLRAETSQEYLESSARSLKAQDERQLENAKLRHDAGNFPPLPVEIDAVAIKKANGATLRQWIRLYGDLQITQRLRGVN